MSNIKRFYVITGKGGTGKTTIALAFTKYLREQGVKAQYLYFDKNKEEALFADLGIPYEELDLMRCVEKYIAKKLKSHILASVIMKAPFFKAILNMVPGFKYLIFLGYILDDKIKQDPDSVVVLDSPSSGHALTMFEACYNFKDIFQVGALVEDINKMLAYVQENNILQINILALPTAMAIHEALELKDHLQEIQFKNSKIFINSAMGQLPGLDESSVLPMVLQKKLQMEHEILDKYKDQVSAFLPYSTSLKYALIIDDLIPHMKPLV